MDSAFNSAPFASIMTARLRELAFEGDSALAGTAKQAAMRAELDRRERRDAGDTSVMTEGERLRFVKAGGLL